MTHSSQSHASRLPAATAGTQSNRLPSAWSALSVGQVLATGLQQVRLWEGRYSNDKGDTGGATMCGVTHGEYDVFRRDKGRPVQDVRKISGEEIAEIYTDRYFRPGLAEKFAEAHLARAAIAILDTSINMGTGRGIAMIGLAAQQAGLIDLGIGDIAGSGASLRSAVLKTKAALPQILAALAKDGAEQKFVDSYLGIRANLYQRFAAHGKSQFLRGWMNRNNSLANKLNANPDTSIEAMDVKSPSFLSMAGDWIASALSGSFRPPFLVGKGEDFEESMRVGLAENKIPDSAAKKIRLTEEDASGVEPGLKTAAPSGAENPAPPALQMPASNSHRTDNISQILEEIGNSRSNTRAPKESSGKSLFVGAGSSKAER